MKQTREDMAQNSAEHAHNAVEAAAEHPSDRMLEQADNSLIHAEIAARQALDQDRSSTMAQSTAQQVKQDRNRLGRK